MNDLTSVVTPSGSWMKNLTSLVTPNENWLNDLTSLVIQNGSSKQRKSSKILISLDWSFNYVNWNNHRTYSIGGYKNDIDDGGVYICK